MKNCCDILQLKPKGFDLPDSHHYLIFSISEIALPPRSVPPSMLLLCCTQCHSSLMRQCKEEDKLERKLKSNQTSQVIKTRWKDLVNHSQSCFHLLDLHGSRHVLVGTPVKVKLCGSVGTTSKFSFLTVGWS